MKTTVNKLRYALLLGFMAIGIAAWSQGVPYINKMSITTQLFLEEMAGNLTFAKEVPHIKLATPSPGTRPLPKPRRPIVDPDTINGKVYIASSVRITNESDLAELESKGVIIQCTFDKGLVTTLIPVDKIEEVAAINGVKRVNVSALLRPLTNLARQATNVDDVLTLSPDAQSAGLPSIYDGTGVILGIIDDGIDFQHKAFTDKNGSTRIKGAYCYNGSSVTADWTGSGTLPTTDDSSEDHGTHTSSIAGGSSVIVSGTNVTVTDNHANATYGGMAPGADLFLGGTQLATTYVLNAFQKMSNYADAQGKPLVVSNSWGSTWYARDGYSDMSDVLAQYFGDNHPNHICLFAAGNEAGMAIGGMGGGRYVTGTSTQASPLGTIVRSSSFIESYGYQYYSGMLANAWTRASNATGIGINIHVINKSNGSLYRTYNYTSTNNGAQNSVTLAGLNLSVYVLFDYVQGQGKHQVVVYTNSYVASSTYVFAIEVYPIGGSNSIVDIYGGDYTYLTNYVSTSGHTWVNGSDDQSMGDEAMDPSVISVGSYVTRNGYNSTGDISDFSSYAAPGAGPTGVQHPWITAPGEVIISGINHYVGANNHDGTVTVNNTTAPYGEMSGTSMATPAAAGIVALWLQAAQEVGKDLTTSEVKNIMAQTAIKDSWVTSGANASHFGNGKINALGGIQYILDTYGSNDPTINASPTTVAFSGEPYQSQTETVNVSGRYLTGDITATLNDPSGVYNINTTNLGNGGNLVITYLPTDQGTYNATITLTSPGAEPVIITITGTAQIKADATICDGTATNQYLPVYGYYFNNAQANQMLYPSSKFTNTGMDGKKITRITFYPTTNGNYSGINFYRTNNQSGTVTIKLANMPSGTTGYTNRNAVRKTADFVTVKTITMPTSAQSGLTEWVFENLEDDFTYDGGDLLIEVTTTTGTRGYTYFAGENQSSYTGMYSYGTTARGQQFLPKVTFEWEADVTPITSGTVSPGSLTFTDIIIGQSSNQAVTVTNTGNQPFTPVIDTTNLPSEFTVTGSGEVLPNGSIDLTVTYSPTDEGPHSGSFTVTIGDDTYTVTVTGNGYRVNNTLLSNEVTVPVYKTDIEILSAYTQQELLDDIDHSLPYNVTNTDVNIKVKPEQGITRYDVYHNAGLKENGENWASGGLNRAVSYAGVDNNSYVYLPHAKNEDLTSWVQQPSVAMSQDEMWVHLNDFVTVQNAATWYVPVVVAEGVNSIENTYGAPIRSSQLSTVTATVNYDQSNVMTDPETNQQYYYMAAEVELHCTVPQVDADADYHYECYKVRAWRLWTPYVVGVGAGQPTETYMGEKDLTGATDEAIIGCKDFQQDGSGHWSYDEPTFCSPVGTTPTFISRFYYKRVPNTTQGPNRAGGGGGGGGGGAGTPGDGPIPPQNPTGIADFVVDRQVVSVTYVNPLGMTSTQPFEGVNIIMTRYNDGTVSTTKVLK